MFLYSLLINCALINIISQVIFLTFHSSTYSFPKSTTPILQYSIDVHFSSSIQGCQAIGRLISVPPLAILVGVQALLSFAFAHADIDVPNTRWSEPEILWFAIGMPTGKSRLTS